MPGPTNFFSAIGGNDSAPKEVWSYNTKPQVKALTNFGLGTINDITPAATESAQRSREAQVRNDALLEQQGSIWQSLLNRPQMDPLGTYKGVGDTLFSYIKPNTLDPIARFNVNQGRMNQRALGLNEAALTSTSQRLADSANSNRVWLDVAKSIIPQINPGFNQVFNAGLASDAADAQRASYIPQWMALNQSNALAPYNPVMARINAWNALSGGFGNQGTNTALNRTGFKQEQNAWDRAGAGVDAIMNRVGQVASIYSSLGGGGMGGGEGGAPSGGGGDGGTIAMGGGNYDNRGGAGWG